jgi:membrane-associated phospholipid phosphatase
VRGAVTVAQMRASQQLKPPGTAVLGLVLGTAAGLAAVVAARGGGPLPADLAVRELVSTGTRDAVRVAAALTQLGAGPVLYPVLIMVCGFTAVRRSPRDLLPVAALAAGQVLELVLFATVHRPSPGGAADGPGLFETTFSSGHSAAAVLGWGLVVRQILRGRVRTASPRMPVWTTALVMGAVVGATRVYLGVHWFSDAVAGIVVGAVLLAAALAALAAVERSGPAPRWRLPAWLTAPTAARPWAWTLPALAAGIQVAMVLASPPDQRLKDLLVYHGAGGAAGAGENLYAFRTVFEMPFTYPPFAALLVEPLSRMPLGLAQTLWTVATLAAVAALAPVALRPVVDRIGLPLTVTALLISSPVRSHLRFGQVGVFLVLLVTLDLLHRNRSRFTGWGLGLAIAVKLTPAVYLPWLLVTRQWRRLGGTLAWLAGATVVGLVLLWPSAGDYMFRASRDTTRFGANDIPGNQSVRGMLLRVLDAHTAERVWLVVAVVLVGVGTWQAWRCARAGNRLAAVGVLAAMSVAVSPISWVHHLVWLVLPIAALAAAGRWRLVTAWFVVLVVSFPSIGGLFVNVQGLTAVAAVLLLPALTGSAVTCPSGRCDGSCSSRPAPPPCTTRPASGS